jgi:flagellar biosynthesis protein FliR
MSLGIDLAWITVVLLAGVRIGALFVLTPVFGAMPMPPRLRVLFALLLAATMVTALQVTSPAAASAARSVGALALAALAEAAIGAAMAFGLFAAFGAFQFAGKLLDIQIGFSLGTVFDPVTRMQAPLLGSLLNLLGVMVFFALDGHLLLMRGIAYSLTTMPPGQLPSGWNIAAFANQFGVMFLFGLTIAAPVVFALLLTDIGLGIASRTMPQLNIFTVGIPVKIVVGLLLFMATLNAMAPVMARVFGTVLTFWQRLGG